MSEIDAHFLSLSKFIRDECAAPEWEKVFFAESSDIKYEASDDVWGGYMRVPRTALRPMDEYRERFESLLGRGYSWINLNAAGIFDGNLLVVIELPNYKSGIPRNKVSVNLSGPSLKEGVPQWDIGARLEITE
jgi:hypothetical protein